VNRKELEVILKKVTKGFLIQRIFLNFELLVSSIYPPIITLSKSKVDNVRNVAYLDMTVSIMVIIT
jgi:hypothetical protein